MMTYTQEQFRQLFCQKFNLNEWMSLLQHFFDASELKVHPEKLYETDSEDQGYYLGVMNTIDNYRIGLFYYDILNSDVKKTKVGLHNLVKQFINPTYGTLDAALVIFDNKEHWRLSFVCDIKEENIAARRYTYVFGDSANYYNTPVSRFMELQRQGISFRNIKEAFSVEALTKQFYKDLFDWYQWAVDEQTGITFPNNTAIEEDDRENIDIKIIRMITRLMFVWFIKQKDLVPDCIFNASYLQSILKNFDSQSAVDGTYYNAILQNLFFATLNRAIEGDEDDDAQRGFARAVGSRDVKTLYRYQELFSISQEEIIQLFAKVPFLNGGLFECLDKTKTLDGVEKAFNYDGFSRNEAKFSDGRYKHRAFVPNKLFFDTERGLFPILNRYNFTIEENTPNEQQVALDPELLGKVFENLLGAYNPETKETARNQSGSFYTPREIVNYMVDESLQAYLGKTDVVKSLFNDNFVKDPIHEVEYINIARRLKSIKVLDPACGSGAYPMGLLNRLVTLLQKIQPQEDAYDLKLSIIENCIYGSDIQSIAAQITKLRFFISLICDCEKDLSKPNFGIPTLPNLETKFVAADSLIVKKKRDAQLNLFENPEIEPTKQELADTRHRHFSAKSASAKRRLRDKDQELREKLAKLLSDSEVYTPADAEQLAGWNPYDQNAVGKFFDPEWMFGVTDGFDLVIGNPPYVQLQNNGGELAARYEKCDYKYKTLARTGDLYCLFYERGWELLKANGHLCYITSNKWMRAGYGEKIRDFFAAKTNPQLLIDFAGVKIFESATVDTNILLFAKANNEHRTVCAITNKQNADGIKNLSLFVQQAGVICDFNSSDSWVILSPIERSVKRKIEAVGTPLKDWNIQINYGIKTGFNDAFIVDTNKRNEILANCQTEEERERTAELIRPILRGRDIKRYGYEWAELWLLYIPWHFPLQFDKSIMGASAKAERVFQEEYPTVYQHLLQYKPQLSARNKAETGIRYEWYAMQRWGANYWEDFLKPKIVWKRVGSILRFSYDENNSMALDSTCFATGKYIKYLVAVLNSKMGNYLLKDAPKTGTGDLLISVQAVEPVKIPMPSDEIENEFIILLDKQLSCFSQSTENQINHKVYALYGLSREEIEFVESQTN